MHIINFITKYLSKRVIIISLIYWVITLFTDNLVYDIYTPIPGSNTLKRLLFYGFYKIIFLSFLLIIFQSILNYLKNSKTNSESWLIRERHFLILLAINVAVFILSYPGTWIWDDIIVLIGSNGFRFGLQTWQHYFTSIYYSFSLMLIPIPSGVVAVQLLIITTISASIIKWININFIKNRWIYLTYIALILPPILFQNAYPLRNTIYAYIELLFAFQLFKITYHKKQVNFWTLLQLTVLISILANWRAEGIYYLIIGTILCLYILRNEITAKQKVYFFTFTLVLGILISLPQKFLKSGVNTNYELTAYIMPIGSLLNAANSDTEKQYIDDIESICMVDSIIQLTRMGVAGDGIYWTGKMYKKNLKNEDISKFKRAYYYLAFNHFDVLLHTQWKIFLQSSCIIPNNEILVHSPLNLCQKTQKKGEDDIRVTIDSIFATYPLNKTINTELRNKYYTLICCRESPSSFEKPTKWLPVFWNNIPPILFLILVTIGLFFTKYRNYGLIVALPLIKLPLIFLTAPAPFFMYYFSLYLIGYMGIFVSIAWLGYKYVPKLFTNKIQS